MPRISKEKRELTTRRVMRYLLERSDTEKKYKIVTGLLESILKTNSKNQGRKDKYISDLQNCLKVLCVHSTDRILAQDKLNEAKKDICIQNDKRSECQDHVLELEYKIKELSEYKSRFEEERRGKYKAETYFGQQLRENEVLLETIKKLKEKLTKQPT